MKQFYVILFLLGIAYGSWGQVISQRAYGGYNEDVTNRVTSISDGYLCVGSTYSFGKNRTIMVIKTDKLGRQRFVAGIYSQDGSRYMEGYVGCEAVEGNGYVVTGLWDNNSIYIAKIDSAGNELKWEKTININNNWQKTEVTSIVPFNGGYVLTANSNNGLFIMQLSSDGTLQKYQVAAKNNSSDAITDLIAVNGNLYIAGYSSNRDHVFAARLNNLSVDNNANIEFTLPNADNNNTDHNITGVRLASDGNSLMLVTKGDNHMNDVMLIKLDMNCSNPSVVRVSNSNSGYLQMNGISNNGNGYSIVGTSNGWNNNNSYYNGFGANDVLLFQTSKTGTISNAHIYGGRDDDNGVSIFNNTDGTNVVFANSRSFGNNNDLFAVITDNKTSFQCHEMDAEVVTSNITSTSTWQQLNLGLQNGNQINTTDQKLVISNTTFRNLCVCSEINEIVSTAPACSGTSVLFWHPNMIDTLKYVWHFSDDAVVTTLKSDSVAVTFKTGGIKYVSVDIPNNGCVLSTSKAITIYKTPTITSVSLSSSGNNSNCTGAEFVSSVALADTAGEHLSYAWDFGSDAATRSANVLSPKGIRYTKPGVKTASLTVNSEHCTSVAKETSVTVNQTPTASFTSNQARCSGLPVSFKNTGTTGALYNWNFTGATVTTATGDSPQATFASEGQKTIQLVTSLGTCRDTAIDAITVYATPSASPVMSLASVCEKARVDASTSATPSTTEHISYSWDFGADAQPKSSDVAAPKGIIYTKAGVKTISLTVQTEHCTSIPQTTTIRVNQKPKAEFDASTPQCTGDSVMFSSTGSTADSYKWTFAADASDIIGSTAKDASARFATEGVKTVVLVTGVAGLCYDTVQHGVTIHKTPSVDFTFDTVTTFKKNKCVNDTVRLNNAGEKGQDWNYTWNLGEGANPAQSTAENASVAYAFGGKKNVTLTIASDYCSATHTAQIRIDTLPLMHIVADGFDVGMKDVRICANTSLKLSASENNDTDYSYKWYLPTNTFEEVKIVKASNVTVAPKAAETIYTLKITNKNTGCIFVDSIQVTMLPAAIANAGIDVVICRGDSVQIGAALIEGQTYSWSPSKGMGSITVPNPVVTPDSTTIYTLKTQYRGCPVETDKVTVTVHQLPNVKVTDYLHGEFPVIARGESIQLLAIGALQYIWTPMEGLSNEGVFDPIASPDKTTEYKVTGTDIYGCINSDTITVRVVIPKFWIPTAFTPNDDNNNDGFIVRGDGITKFELQIFTRNGEQVFFSEDPKVAWNGRKDGTNRDLPQGAYIYYTKGTLSDGTLFEKRGVVNLLR